MAPPNTIATSATPKLEPAEIPIIDGPASGLLKIVCIISPATASDAPARNAVANAGKRDSTTMKWFMSSPDTVANNVRNTSPGAMATLPHSNPAGNIIAIAMARNTIVRAARVIICGSNI